MVSRPALLLASCLLAACSGPSSSSDAGASSTSTLAGRDGRFTFTVTPQEAPHQGANSFVVAVHRSAGGQPVTGAALRADAVMPSMGHSSTETPVVRENGAGSYRVSNVVFSMAGTWEVTWHAQAGADSDAAASTYDIP